MGFTNKKKIMKLENPPLLQKNFIFLTISHLLS